MTPCYTLMIFTVLLLLNQSSAHYVLIQPKPYNVIHCDKPDCSTPCPPVWKSGDAKAQNTPETTTAVWRRGQKVNVEWHMNNHHGGFIRRSLVPVSKMFDWEWHEKTAFEWGCFAQGLFKCNYKLGPKSDRLRHLRTCGTDAKQRAFSSRSMKVPEVFPDGDYVFSQVWYGGITYDNGGEQGMFPDFKTCAYVRIEGGSALKESYEPQFKTGVPFRSEVPHGKCVSYASKVNECDGLACPENEKFFGVPQEFQDDQTPPKIHANILKPFARNGDENIEIDD